MSANKYKILTLSSLKWIALITMLIDHIAATALPYYNLIPNLDATVMDMIYIIMRGIGRISFPIFCFCIVEGFVHTRNIKKYIIRLLIFAIITEPVYDLAFFGEVFYFGYQNVLWTFLIAIVMLIELKQHSKNLIAQILILVISVLFAWFLKTDYSYIGVIIIAIYYFFREKFWVKLVGTGVLFLNTAIVGAAITYLYNGERGKSLKYLFYIFYPAHLLLLYFINNWIYMYLKGIY